MPYDESFAARAPATPGEGTRRATTGRSRAALATAVFLLAFAAPACGGSDESEGSSPAIDPADYSSTVDHPLVPFTSVRVTVFEGSEPDPETGELITSRAERRVLNETETVAGIEVLVVQVKEYEDDELVEQTLDYFAQHRDGSVWYLGERVDDIEGGKVVGHEGQWLAGEGNARPGLFMPAEPKVGQTFEQERAPGIAEDRSTVVEVGVDVTTPAGEFSDCIKTEDFAPLDDITEFKYYCPGVGLVREELPGGGRVDLVSYE